MLNLFPMNVPLSQITVLGTGDLMPVLVYGFEATKLSVDSGAQFCLPLDGDAPDWLIAAFVQAGGYSMSYYSVVGAVFRLADNAARANKDPSKLLRSFHLMAEDPDLPALKREFPRLVNLCATRGKPYDSAQLATIGQWIQSYFPVPSPQGGLEAFMRLGHPSDEQMFGWNHLHVKNSPRVLEDLAVREAVVVRGKFGPNERRLLKQIGERLFSGPAALPQLYLVWENSD
jgi:hypothetical protein